MRLEILAATLAGALAVAAPGCERDTSSSAVNASIDDTVDNVETLKNARQLMTSGNHDSAISLLESYQSDSNLNIATKHILLAEGYFHNLKEIIVKEEGSRSTEAEIVELSKKIDSSLRVATKLVPGYKSKIWDFYLTFDGECMETDDNSSILGAIRTLLYGLSKKDERIVRKVFDAEETRKSILEKIEAEIENYKDPRKFRNSLTFRLLTLKADDKTAHEYERNPKLAYDHWRAKVAERMKVLKEVPMFDLAPYTVFLGKNTFFIPFKLRLLTVHDNKIYISEAKKGDVEFYNEGENWKIKQEIPNLPF